MTEEQKEYMRNLLGRRSVMVPECGCWIWMGAVLSKGHGSIRAFGGVHFNAHRASYEAHVSAIPDGLHVLHKCDVSSCVNPDHLFVGTNTDNIIDSMKKGKRKGVTRKRPSGLKYKPMSDIGRFNHTAEGRRLKRENA